MDETPDEREDQDEGDEDQRYLAIGTSLGGHRLPRPSATRSRWSGRSASPCGVAAASTPGATWRVPSCRQRP
jgi:hypothetical protein